MDCIDLFPSYYSCVYLGKTSLKAGGRTESGYDDDRVVAPGSYALKCTFVGLTKSIAGLLLGRLQTVLTTQLGAVDVGVAVESDSGSTGNSSLQQQLLNNPRQMQMATSTLQTCSINFKEREHAVLFLAHTVVWRLRCMVYGGFVRDWVIRGENANDIDVKLAQGQDPAAVAEQLSHEVKSAPGLHVAERKVKGSAYTVVIGGPWKGRSIDVDLVSTTIVTQKPGVDADVDNLAIDPTGQLVKRVREAGGEHLSLIAHVQHCQAKQFVFFYSPSDAPDMVRTRLKKLFDRGWVCIGFSSHTGVDGADHRALLSVVQPQHHAQVKPKAKYCMPWAK
jgi:hypothetical protein